MTDLQQLEIMAHQLCENLAKMAENERLYGAHLCHLIEQISYDFYKSACELKEIREYIGGVA